MVEKIFKSIADRLRECNNKEIKIYENDVKQGLEKPCFFINLENSETSGRLGNRYFQANKFKIIYYPENEDSNIDLFKISKEISLLLEVISTDEGSIRGKEMKSEIKDGLLNFYVNYDVFLFKQTASVGMIEDIEVIRGVKNGE